MGCMIYFTADTHFCHSNTIGRCGRPFANVDEMSQVLMDSWNSCVTDRDEIYILGDFMFKEQVKEANEILARRRGVFLGITPPNSASLPEEWRSCESGSPFPHSATIQ